MRDIGIPNTYSLAWRLGRVVAISQQAASLSTVGDDIIKECGGEGSARRIFQGKIRSVESNLTSTAHSIGKVTIERLGDNEVENDSDRLEGPMEVIIPFMNENLAAIAVDEEGKETVLATVPDLIMLLDVSTGEAIGVQEYREVSFLIMLNLRLISSQIWFEGDCDDHGSASYLDNKERSGNWRPSRFRLAL
jgi:DUF917 family protein